MKHLFSLLILCFLSGFSHSNHEEWKWEECSSELWRHIFSKSTKGEIIPCREPEFKKIGVVDKQTGLCKLLSNQEEINDYDIFKQTVADYFHWVDERWAGCYWGLSSFSKPEAIGRPENCLPEGERLCRYRDNDKWVTGLADRNECVDFQKNHVRIYELFIFNHHKYKPVDTITLILFGFGTVAIALCLWLVTFCIGNSSEVPVN